MRKKILKIVISVVSIAVVVALLLLLMTRCSTEVGRLPAFLRPERYDTVGGATVAENSRMELRWSAAEMQIYLYDKATDMLWGPRSTDTMVDGELSSRKHPQVYSPVFITYFDQENFTEKSAYANTSSIQKKTVGQKQIDNGISVQYDFESEEISVTVDYVLRDDSLLISVDTAKLTEGSKNLITSISVAPYLCGLPNGSEDSYLFVPSGSGALIYPDVRMGKAATTAEKVYGLDYTINQNVEFNALQGVRLPVYGVKYGAGGLCAIIEKGAATAEINTVSNNTNIGFATVYSTTYVRGYDIIDMPEGFGSGGTTKLCSDPIENTVFQVGFYPFGGEDCSYVTMADIYRDYLAKSSNFDLTPTEDATAVNINIVGGLLEKKHFLGVPYNGLSTLTSIAEAGAISDRVYGLLGGNYAIELSGFASTGISVGKTAGGGKIDSAMGSGKEIKKFFAALTERDVSAFVDFDTVRYDSGALGVSARDAALRVDKKRARLTFKNFGSGMPNTDIAAYFLIGRDQLEKLHEKLLKRVETYGAVGLTTLTNMSYSDYSSKDYYACLGMEQQVSAILRQYREKGIAILGSDANDYAAVLCDRITDVPLSSSEYSSFDETVPFYEIVFRGYIPMTSKSLNSFTDFRIGLLKAVEAGVGITLDVSERHNDQLIYSVYNLSSVSTPDELEISLAAVKDFGFPEYCKAVAGAAIRSHSVLDHNVRRTEFSNDVCVYVNYSDSNVTVDGITVTAMNYSIVKGGESR